MLEALKFVQGAVAKKNFVQALTHFHIADGFIKGYNGSLALCSPIDLDLKVTPRAIPFIKAIQTCKTTVQLNMTPSGRLSVKSGKFRAYVECVEDVFPDIEPEGETIILNGDLLKALKVLLPFIAEDASRPWARGVLFRGPSAFATNNISLVEYWLGYHFPIEVNIPKPAVQELLRIGEEPSTIRVSENNVTFLYKSGRWLRTQTYSTKWPDMTKVLERESKQTVFPENFFTALTDLMPFIDEFERVYINGEVITTTLSEDQGASMKVNGLPASGIFNIKQLQLLENIATTIDLTQYPAPCLFFGDRLRGAVIGMRG